MLIKYTVTITLSKLRKAVKRECYSRTEGSEYIMQINIKL